MDKIVTIKGKWLDLNEFVDEDGVLYTVVPYQYIAGLYRNLLPIDCYLQLEGTTIIAVCPIDNFM